MADAIRNLAGLIRAMTDTSFFTITTPIQRKVYNGADYAAQVESCDWLRKSIKGHAWSIHYILNMPGQLAKNIYVHNADEVSTEACKEALAVAVEWFADNPNQYSYDVDAKDYA